MDQGASSPGPADEDLRKVLAESERRKAAEFRRLKATFHRYLLVGIPAFLLILAVTALLRSGRTEPAAVEVGAASLLPSAAPAAVRRAEEQEGAGFDLFRDGKDQVGKAPGPHPGKGELLDKDNVQFAMELLNFMHPGGKPPAKQP